ncbi:MAG: NrfD/PsrC family molybdoenzyme membrane anchor subunit [Nitrospiria bacterium]
MYKEQGTVIRDQALGMTRYAELDQAVVRSLTVTSRRYWLLVGALALVVIGAVFTYLYQVRAGLWVTGLNNPVFWGGYILTFIFWIGLSHAGTLLSAVLHLTQSHWRKPIYRGAEVMTLFALVNAGLLPIIHLGRGWYFYWIFPPYPNQRGLWPNMRSPLSWDSIAINTYLVGSALFLFLGMIPDLATVRDHTKGWRRRLYQILSLGWKGEESQWQHFRRTYTLMASFLIPLMVSVHSIVAWDFAVSIMHGLHSTIFAPAFVLGAIYSGVAAVITLTVLIRKYFHFEAYIHMEHLEKLAIFLFVLCLLWNYMMFVETFVLWQTEDMVEFVVMRSKIAGPYAWMFWSMIFSIGILPLLLILKKVRSSIRALLIISILINAGLWVERFLILIPSLAYPDDPYAWGPYTLSAVEITILIGTLAFFSLNFLIFIKIFPSVSMYEIKEMLPLQRKEA